MDIVESNTQEVFELASRYGLSAYDAAYLALAQSGNMIILTADERLYNAVKKELPWVVWFDDWRSKLPIDPGDGSGSTSQGTGR